ncbi:MAG: hypothetical protein F6K19_41780 [Cyanothece sp. SIO1E1]|nr:hypothetical protein [Cyanothece sp. SIO1E1]
MGTFSGLNDYVTEGSIGVAIIAGVGGNLAFKDFQTNADASDLQACLTIRGDLSKRLIDLGKLPQTSGSFDVPFPADADVSLFNTVVVQTMPADGSASKSIGSCPL